MIATPNTSSLRENAPVTRSDAPGAENGTRNVAGLLLTGGSSSRLGLDKATLAIDGETLARRTGRILVAALGHALEVGPGVSGLPAVTESPRGGGPLVALACGAEALARGGHRGPAVVVATDLPHLTGELLLFLASRPGEASAVPVVDGRTQPLCARWSAADLGLATELVRDGARSLMALLDRTTVELLGPDMWGAAAEPSVFADIDTVDDLDRARARARRGRRTGSGSGPPLSG